MDDPTSNVSSRRSSRRTRRKAIAKRISVGVGILLVLGLLALGAKSAYKLVRERRTVARARALLDKKSYGEARLSIGWALQMNPKDVAANKMMAELEEATGSRVAVVWRQRVDTLQPGVLENQLAVANVALRYRDVPAAQQALSEVDQEGKKTAAYHSMAARLSMALNDHSLVESNLNEALRVDPDSELLKLEAAALGLGSPKPEVREQAHARVEALSTNPKLRRGALRALLQYALFSKNSADALKYAAQMNATSDSTFGDHVLYASILRKAGRREFWWFLPQLEDQAAKADPASVTALMTWLNKTGMARVTVEWAKNLSDEVRTKHPVPVGIAEACAMLDDWAGVKGQVKFGEWGDLEFQRQALLARCLRDTDEAGSHSRWSAAVSAAGERPEALATLARLSRQWGWDDEAINVLWLVARGKSNQQSALDLLNRIYASRGKTRELLNVANRLVELDPDNATNRNNAAYLSFLLNVDLERAHALSKAVYQRDPQSPVFATTYALSLYLQGKVEQGLKVLRALPERDLEAPSNAFLYGILLADARQRDQAVKYLDFAEKGQLLPQEQTLVAKARERLPLP